MRSHRLFVQEYYDEGLGYVQVDGQQYFENEDAGTYSEAPYSGAPVISASVSHSQFRNVRQNVQYELNDNRSSSRDSRHSSIGSRGSRGSSAGRKRSRSEIVNEDDYMEEDESTVARKRTRRLGTKAASVDPGLAMGSPFPYKPSQSYDDVEDMMVHEEQPQRISRTRDPREQRGGVRSASASGGVVRGRTMRGRGMFRGRSRGRGRAMRGIRTMPVTSLPAAPAAPKMRTGKRSRRVASRQMEQE